VLILFVAQAHLDVEDVETHNRIMQKTHKPFDLFDNFFEKFLMLAREPCRGFLHFIKCQIVLNRLRLALYVKFEYVAEVVFEADDRVVVHVG